MTLAEKLRRIRFKQMRAVGRALWMEGPFTRTEARLVGHQIQFNAIKAARLIRAGRG